MKFKTQPYKHQLECLEKFGEREYFALLAEMGTGKTWIAINNFADLYLRGLVDAVLVLAPNGVHSNWTRIELPKHMPDEVSTAVATWTSSFTKIEKLNLESMYTGTKWLRILAMNWEALSTKKGVAAAQKFVESSDKLMIVCDESDSVKNPSAKRTKNLMKLKHYHLDCSMVFVDDDYEKVVQFPEKRKAALDKIKPFAQYRRIMSGTPVNNSPFDIFSQFSFLDPKILKTTSFWAFKAEYAELLPSASSLVQNIQQKTGRVPQIVAKGPGGRPKYKNLDRLAALIAPHSFRVLKKDCLDLPKKIYKTLHFDLTYDQTIVYRKCEKECRLVFENEETPFNKLVAVTKLAQITSGYYLHPLADEPVRIGEENPKLDLLIKRVQKVVESDRKVIIWARYRVEIADIMMRLKLAKLSAVELHGGIKSKDRDDSIDQFENGIASVFVGNPQAGGMGITLVAASYVIYFSNDFSYRKRAQSEDRSHRIGQVRNVTYINIAAKNTIDEVIIDALLNKKSIADEIIDRGLELFR